jgi:hypothetical protein
MHANVTGRRPRIRLALATLAPIAMAFGCVADRPATTGIIRPSAATSAAWGPETPNFNLEVILRPPPGADGFGHVKFRQPNDADKTIYLDVWVRDLVPNAHYRLQRAVDSVINDDCTSASWLTLGKGAVAQDVVTDDRGTATEQLFRVLTNAAGTEFDIHFRLINAAGAVVLASQCYQFAVSP